ncbi:surface lipoprotein assembly modifier [Ignavibacterium sp.]|uniref:surface lipoprotein assembly modifier n=1 Tax=Ignavibacterium sp. TaxID=2651167 RepID=UPI00307D0432
MFSNYEHKAFLKWISNFETNTSLIVSAEFNYKKYLENYNYEGYANDGSYLKFLVNIGQSLSEKTGINLFASVRKNLSEKSRYIVSDSLIFYEEEIFNDLYSFNSIEAGIGFTQILGDDFKLSTELRYSPKYFTSLYTADEFGVELPELREDKQLSFGFSIEYDLGKILEGLSASVTYNYIKNKSNDYYYDYSNQIFSFTFGYGF